VPESRRPPGRGPSTRWMVLAVLYCGLLFALAVLFVTRDADQAGSVLGGTFLVAFFLWLFAGD